MKLKSYYEKEETDNEDQLYISLYTCPKHKDMMIGVVDKKGKKIKGGALLLIDFDMGGIIICDSTNPNLGLKTDLDGHLLTTTEKEMRRKHEENTRYQFAEMMSKRMDMRQQEENVKH